MIYGGLHATLYPDEARELGGAHAVVTGDGDHIWPEVLRDAPQLRDENDRRMHDDPRRRDPDDSPPRADDESDRKTDRARDVPAHRVACVAGDVDCDLVAVEYAGGADDALVQATGQVIEHAAHLPNIEQASRFTHSLIKLVPTEWGPPTFEIDGIKMLPTAQVSPYADAERKVALVAPRGKRVLDTCGGLGYFAAWCLTGGAAHVQSYEKNADVLWLRSLNPWSPSPGPQVELVHGDVVEELDKLPSDSFDAVLHDPPRFGIAGELYSQAFYGSLARVLKRNAPLFHYTGTPNKLRQSWDELHRFGSPRSPRPRPARRRRIRLRRRHDAARGRRHARPKPRSRTGRHHHRPRRR